MPPAPSSTRTALMAAATAVTKSPSFALPTPPPAVAALPVTSVWLEFTPLAAHTRSINLGQGFPDWAPPSFLVDAAVVPSSAPATAHQYARSAGDLKLVSAIARHYGPRLAPPQTSPGIPAPDLDPLSQVIVTVGASHALSLAISALAGPGDEVVLVQPAFDVYTGAVRIAGATPVYASLKLRPAAPASSHVSARDLVLDIDDLASCITPRTRLLILNSPHNPTGKVFTREELTAIAALLDKHPQVAVVSDEVCIPLLENARPTTLLD
jgi:aspartate/methionine/tyrosine aminotransferase